MNKFDFILDKIRDPKVIKIAVIAAILCLAAIVVLIKSIKVEPDTVIIEEGEEVIISNAEESKASIYVDIDGEVNNPGVYEVESGMRLFELIELAGGLTDEADPKTINRAKMVEDGDKIIVPKTGADDEGISGSGLVNLNLASKEDLETLPGIGPVTAETIITYREENNGFQSKEEIMNISGIGSVTYGKVKDLITT